jgi:HD-like signal output (HDOD) protein
MKINNDVMQRLDAVQIPTLPSLVMRLAQLLGQDGTTAQEIAAAVQVDATMSARVLRLANSVVLGGEGEVESVADAVMRVGVEGVRDIVFALSMMGVMQPMNFDYRIFWRHSLAVANTARLLQARAPQIEAQFTETYSAGLLHDMGMLVLDRALGSQYKQVLAVARSSGRPLFEVEREMLGTDHAEAGSRLLKAWDLPLRLIEAARSHHRPRASESRVTHLVYLADLICNNLGFNHGTGFLPKTFADRTWADLGLQETDLPEIAVAVRREVEQVERIIATA